MVRESVRNKAIQFQEAAISQPFVAPTPTEPTPTPVEAKEVA